MIKSALEGPRYRYPVSEKEMERRLAAVQSAMKAQGIDCCVAQCQSLIFDSVTRYLTDIRAHAYNSILLIPADGLITVINHGGDNDQAKVPPSMRNVGRLITKPYCQPFECSDGLGAEAALKELKAGEFKKIGFIYKQLMSFELGMGLTEGLAGVEFTDFSKEFSRIKAVKSGEEWQLIDRSIRAHEYVADMIPALLRPGRMEYEVLADLEHAAKYMGCEWMGNVAVGAMPKGSSAPFHQTYTANRRIEHGDLVTIMLEIAGPGGMYGELARAYSIGEPHEGIMELYDIALKAQWAVAGAAKPGVTGRELDKVYNEFLAGYGLPPNSRFVGHGQGYDMMEAPAICPTEDMALEEDMLLAIHPEIMRGSDFAIACDNFRVRSEGAERITRTEQKVFVLEY